MSDLTIPSGDKGYDLNFTVKDAEDEIKDLTDYTVTLKVWKPGKTSADDLIVSDTCDIDVAASGTCHYTIQSGDFDSRAKYKMELELSKTGVVESTENYDLKIEESA
jgi:hypothetical protein